MMTYNMMSGASGSGMMLFSWVAYILVIALLVLGIAALWKYKEERRVIPTGMLWRSGWNNEAIVPSFVGPEGDFGHSFFWKGQRYIKGKRHLVAQLSNGVDVGEQGLMYFPEKIVNQEATYGNFMFLDYPAGWTKEDIIMASQEWEQGFYKTTWTYFKRFFLWR